MRYRARKDANHNDIADCFVSCGATVADTSQLGGDFPDMVIALCGFNVLVEVKDGSKSPSKSKLSDGQNNFMLAWRGWYVVIKSVDDALALVAEIKRRQVAMLRSMAVDV